MKKSILFSLLCLVLAALGVSCEQPEEPTPAVPEGDFKVVVHDVSRGSVRFSVTPKNDAMDYLCVVYERADVEEYSREEFLVESVFMDITTEAYDQGKTFAEYMLEVVDRGTIENVSFSGLTSDTEYYIILFGVDAEHGYKAITSVTKTLFKTANIATLDCSFEVNCSVVNNTVDMSVSPSDESISWYLCTMPVEQYNYYVEDEAGYQMSHDYFYQYYFQQEINSLLEQGSTAQQVLEKLVHKGTLTLQAKGLKENTDYYYLIAGLVVDEEGIAISTEVERGMYTTGRAEQSSMTFDIKVWDVGQMEASFSITPSNNDDKYCALVAPWDGVTEAQDMMHNLVEQWGGWMEVMADDRGPVEHSGAKAMKLPAADTDYYIIAFGYDGGITTEATMVTFRTLPGGSVDEVEFSIKTTSVSPYGFTMNVTSTDNTIYYQPGVCRAEEYNEELFIQYETEAFDYYVEEYKKFNPTITVAEILDQYYYNGGSTLQVSGLMPDTEYMGYIFALDVRTGKVVKSFSFPAIARTSQLSDVAQPQVELVGYFSGDEEAGRVFDDAAATKGRVITVVKYTNLEGVRTLFSMISPGDVSNPLNTPDAELWGLTLGYWKTVNTEQPYSYYLTDWNEVYTALCYATDTSGVVGPMNRLYTCATADNKSDIQKLIDLTNEQNTASKSSFTLPESLVFGEAQKSGVTIKALN